LFLVDLDYSSSIKIKMHMWLAFHDRLLTTNNLTKRDIHITSSCLICGINPETAIHIFLHCA